MDRGTGMFCMDDVAKVTKMTLEEAKQYLHGKILSSEGVQKANLAKATKLLNTCTSTTRLAIAVSNFILAHSDEKLKVIRA